METGGLMTDDECGFQKVDMPRLAALTITGNEVIYYKFWVDSDGHLYIKMLEGSGGGGKVSDYYFELNSVLEDFEAKSEYIKGIKNSRMELDRNTNTKGFLRAIVQHLLLQKV
jgi:hypothetical protein